MTAIPEYTHVILSGGGLCGLSYLGIYRYLKQYKQLNKVRHIAGCSIGGLFAVVFALNRSVEETEKDIFELLNDPSGNTFDPSAILSIFQNKGTYSLESYRTLFQTYLQKKTGLTSITFQEFTKHTGINLYLSVFCLNTLTNEILSNISHPNVDVATAMCASMAIPGIFQAVQINGQLYVDGGIGTALPIDCFKYQPTDRVLAINLSFNPHKTTQELQSLSIYLQQLMAAILFSQTFKVLKRYENHPSIDLINVEDSPIDFLPMKVVGDQLRLLISKDNYDEAILYGYQLMYQYMLQRYKNKTTV